jgi:hypothetical protein
MKKEIRFLQEGFFNPRSIDFTNLRLQDNL